MTGFDPIDRGALAGVSGGGGMTPKQAATVKSIMEWIENDLAANWRAWGGQSPHTFTIREGSISRFAHINKEGLIDGGMGPPL